MTENRDFIPYKIAKRLKETIIFTILLDSRSKEINNGMAIDIQTTEMLKKYE